MQSTRISLLANARAGSEHAWTRLVELYQPLVYGWLRRHDVAHHDAEELTQEVLTVVVQELPRFSHSGNRGAFRHWLRQVTVNRAKGFWRSGKLRPAATGDSNFREIIDQLADDGSEISKLWDREYDNHVLRQLLQQVESECEPATFQAFRRLVFEEHTAADVARDLGQTIGATYSARARVLRRLRELAAGIIDLPSFS